MHNAAGQRLDDQRAAIPDQDADIAAAAQVIGETSLPKILADYNRPDQY